MKFKIQIISFLFISIFSSAQSDTSKKELHPSNTYTIYFDGYLKSDFSKPSKNNRTSFTNSDKSLELGIASIKIDHVSSNFSSTLDLGVGKRAQEFSYNDNGLATVVKQAYLSYAPIRGLKITAGKWATHFGYELLDATSNRNYSMSYGYTFSPFFHSGLKTEIALGGKWALMMGIAQPTDFVIASSSNKVFIAQLSSATKFDQLKGLINFMSTKDKSQFEIILNGAISSSVSINYDGTKVWKQANTWSSNALYINYDPNTKLGFTVRSEYFNDENNLVGVGTSIFQNTLSANLHFYKWTIIPEIRLDNSNNKIFINSNNNLNQYAGNFIIAAVYKI